MSDLAFLSSDEEDNNEPLTTTKANTKGEENQDDDKDAAANDDDTTSESSQSSEEEFVEDFEFGGMMVCVFLSFFKRSLAYMIYVYPCQTLSLTYPNNESIPIN